MVDDIQRAGRVKARTGRSERVSVAMLGLFTDFSD